jgi:hypothetical protein
MANYIQNWREYIQKLFSNVCKGSKARQPISLELLYLNGSTCWLSFYLLDTYFWHFIGFLCVLFVVTIAGCSLWNLWRFSNQRWTHAHFFPRKVLFIPGFSLPTSSISAKGTMWTNQLLSTTRFRFLCIFGVVFKSFSMVHSSSFIGVHFFSRHRSVLLLCWKEEVDIYFSF